MKKVIIMSVMTVLSFSANAYECLMTSEVVGTDRAVIQSRVEINTSDQANNVIYEKDGLYVNLYSSGVATLLQFNEGDKDNHWTLSSTVLNSAEMISYLSLRMPGTDTIYAVFCGSKSQMDGIASTKN